MTVGTSVDAAVTAPAAAAGAPVLEGPRRWSLAYGSNASPDRLVDKGLDLEGAILLPASVMGYVRAWEARRTSSTGAVPLTIVAVPGHRLDVHVLGVTVADAAVLDTSEGRGPNYALGHVGPVALAHRFLLEDALAYGPTATTRVLAVNGAFATYPEFDQAAACRLLDTAEPSTLPAAPLRAGGPSWPDTTLSDLPLFVYGTLQPNHERWRRISDLVDVVGPAETWGSLVNTVYGWPAATFGDRGRVRGTLLAARYPEAAVELFAVCDDIEDVPRLFRRTTVRVWVGPRTSWAATYEWNAEQGAPPGSPVDDGTWRP